jgi:hypothetical protein
VRETDVGYRCCSMAWDLGVASIQREVVHYHLSVEQILTSTRL